MVRRIYFRGKGIPYECIPPSLPSGTRGGKEVRGYISRSMSSPLSEFSLLLFQREKTIIAETHPNPQVQAANVHLALRHYNVAVHGQVIGL